VFYTESDQILIARYDEYDNNNDDGDDNDDDDDDDNDNDDNDASIPSHTLNHSLTQSPLVE
jgi:hypothetical protein